MMSCAVCHEALPAGVHDTENRAENERSYRHCCGTVDGRRYDS
jgi:hypothetical protein